MNARDLDCFWGNAKAGRVPGEWRRRNDKACKRIVESGEAPGRGGVWRVGYTCARRPGAS